MKQGFGLIDCRAKRFSAMEFHVNISLTAYLPQQAIGRPPMRIEEFARIKEAKVIKSRLREFRRESTQFGSGTRLKPLIESVVQSIAA